ncbi:MAG: TonB-dependent receptor [Steroidobacteraceae bacterium]
MIIRHHPLHRRDGSRARLGIACLLIASGAPLAAAHAASADTAQSAEDDTGTPTLLHEVIVTAEKRAEPLQRVPAQVEVFTSQEIEQRGITDTADYIAQIPNMTFDRADTYNNSWVVVRGIASVTNADPPIAVVVDGVPQVDQLQLNQQMFDIDSIQVLKGPQGTLYGRDALGGAIVIQTQAPTPDFSASGDLTYGNGGMTDLRGEASGPMGSQAVGYRLAATYLTQNGLISDTYPGAGGHSDFIHYDYDTRGTILAHLPADWTLELNGDFGRHSGATNQYSWIQSDNPNQFLNPTYGFYPSDVGMTGGMSAKLEGPLSFATLTWISGYNRMYEDNRASISYSNPVQDPLGLFDLGFQAAQGQDLGLTSYFQELRLTSPSQQRFRWVTGVSYQYLDKSLLTRVFIDENGSPSQFWDSSLVIANSDYEWVESSFGAYGQADYDILPDLTFTGGLRYDFDDRTQQNLVTGSFLHSDFLAWQPKATLSWRPTDRQTYYITASTGYRPGGFNPTGTPSTFTSEYLRNYEAGWKTLWLAGSVHVDGAVFYDTDHGYQYFNVFSSPGGGFTQVNQNINLVVIKGAELETQWYPTLQWELFANAGYTDSDIAKLDGVPSCSGLSASQVAAVDYGCYGSYTPYLTPWTGQVGTQYRQPITANLSFFGRVSLGMYSKKIWEVNNIAVQNPKQYLDLRAGIEGVRWSAWLWGKNITDTRAYSQYVRANPFGIGVAGIGYLVPPATYGIELSMKY